MSGYKIRLGDGSEIGPMDLATLRTWIAQGAVDRDSPVMRPGTRRWVPLGTLPEMQTLTGRSRPKATRGRRTAPGVDAAEQSWNPGRLDRARHVLVGVLLLVAAGGFGWLAWKPEQAIAIFDGAPWLELALGALALGLGLLPGWNWARRGVRLVLLLAGFALFPIFGVILAQGQRGSALVALASAWPFVFGLWALLAPGARLASVATGALLVAAGVTGALRFGYARESASALVVREWAEPTRRFNDEAAGLRLDLPDGWLALRSGSPLVKAPPGARLTLVQPRLSGFAWLTTEPAPKGVGTADAYLAQLVAQRRKERPGYETTAPRSQAAGTVPARRVSATWVDAGTRQREVIVAGLDGWMGFALVAWMPEAAANRANGLDPLADALVARGVLEARLGQSLDAALEAVPHLTREAAQQLMARSEARVLEPEQAFRRSLAALAKQSAGFDKAEAAELAQLTNAIYAVVPWRERSRVASYIERLRRDEVTGPEEDAAMLRLFKDAEQRLSAARRLRLQAYYDKVIL